MSQENALKPQGRYRSPCPPMSQQGYRYDSPPQHVEPAYRSTFPRKVKFKVSKTGFSFSSLSTKSQFSDLKIFVVCPLLLKTMSLVWTIISPQPPQTYKCGIHSHTNIQITLGHSVSSLPCSSELFRKDKQLPCANNTICFPLCLLRHVYLQVFVINHEAIAAENPTRGQPTF